MPGLNTRSRIIGELRGMFRLTPSYPPIQGVVHIYVTKVVFSPTQCLKNALNVPLCHPEVEGRSPNTNFREIQGNFLRIGAGEGGRTLVLDFLPYKCSTNPGTVSWSTRPPETPTIREISLTYIWRRWKERKIQALTKRPLS